MKPPLRFLSETIEEIIDTRVWYENQREGLGEEFLSQLSHSLIEIQDRPLSFPIVHRSIRRAILKRYPYCIYFVMLKQEIVVLAVAHGSRRPSAWQRRWMQ